MKLIIMVKMEMVMMMMREKIKVILLWKTGQEVTTEMTADHREVPIRIYSGQNKHMKTLV